MAWNSLRLFGRVQESIVDGPGIRYVLFCQGCYHDCNGCHNPLSHSIDGGQEVGFDVILEEIQQNPLLDGITLSGGEPMLQATKLIELVKKVKSLGYHVILYTGYTYEQLKTMSGDQYELFTLCDIMIDGKYEKELRSLSLLYRGSKNQRIINIKESLNQNQCIEYIMNEFGELK